MSTSADPTFETTQEAGSGGMIDPIHVVIDGRQSEKEVTPEFGSWQTISWPAGTSAAASAQPLVPEARKRHEAQVLVTILPVTTTPTVNAIPLSATGVASYNNNSVGVNATVSGGTVTAIAINGVTTGATSGTFFVPAGGTITITYSVAPTLTTAGIPVTAVSPTGFVRIGSNAQVLNNAGAQIYGARIPIDNSQQVWVASDGVNPASIAVLDERYL